MSSKRIRRTPKQIEDGITIEDIKKGIKTIDEKIKRMPSEMKAEDLETKNGESSGIGNVVAKIAKVTGIAKAVTWIAGEDCGCDERRKKLNLLLKSPVLCLTEAEYINLHRILVSNPIDIGQRDAGILRDMYARIKGISLSQIGSCGGCNREMIRVLKIVLTSYS